MAPPSQHFENEDGSSTERLPLLVAHSSGKKKRQAESIPCSGPGCSRSISPDAAEKVRYCGICQLREREILLEVGDVEVSEGDLALLWTKRNYYRISEAARFLGLKTRTLYALVSKGRIRALRSKDGCLVVPRSELIAHGRAIKGVIGLKEAAESMDIDYGYLRELVRRHVIESDRTFWGHYGIRLSRIQQVKAELERALPDSEDYNLVSCSESLGVHHSLVQKWIKQGKIVATKGLTGRITIPKAELDRFVRLVRERPRFLPPRVRMRVLGCVDGEAAAS